MGQNGADTRPDPIDKAIAATEQQVTMMQVQLPLGSGRPMVVALPSDFSDVEAVQAMQGLLMAMDQMRAQRQVQTPSGIVLPNKPTLLRS
jgi:hypothetical protein